VAVQSDEASDLISAITEAVLDRRRRAAVRLEISAGAPSGVRRWIKDWLGLRPDEVYETAGLLDTAALMELATRPGFDELKTEPWEPQPPRDLLGRDDLWEAIQEQDVLLCHPYERFDPVVRLIDEAADDPGVLAIKQTLYRTSGDSPIVRALGRAARNGKEVTVLVELKARFDEARNVDWARRLEDAGCNVIYGLAGLKTHSKALLIVRREAGRIHRYAHLATGNYNDKTARLYSDTGILTADRDTTADVAGFFNLLTGQTDNVAWRRLVIAPTGIRRRFLELIDREIERSTPAAPGLIMAKVNSLQDKGIIHALYRASTAGVRVLLNVRGICCLRPGVPGLSENIEVRSIVDRFLEHARIFYFANGGREEVYMSSADWMGRNLDKRVEILFPVLDRKQARRCIKMLEIYFADNTKAYRMLPGGEYVPFREGNKPLRAQEWLYDDAVSAAQGGARAGQRFVPLRRPQD
jgi:polyphosphate kinase